jgi:iron complex outermembrane receptor protein
LAVWCALSSAAAFAQGEGLPDAGDPVPLASPPPVAFDAGEPPAVAPPHLAPIEALDLELLLDLPVVTATGKAESRALAAANVYAVTREEIARHGWRSVAEVLAQVPGLYVTDDLVQPSIGVRGTTGGLGAGTRIVKVMINGVPVNFRPDLSAFIGLEYLPIEAVERVEVAKGPLSALYGANAFLAVVNVITVVPSGNVAEWAMRGSMQGTSPGFGISGLVGQGTETGHLLAAASTDRVDRSGMKVGQTFKNQQPMADDFTRASEGDVSTPMSVFVQAAESRPWLGSVSVQGGYQHRDAMAEFQVRSLLTHKSRVALDNTWANARHEKEWAKGVRTVASFGWATGGPTRDYQLYLTNSNAFEFHPNFGYSALTGTLEAQLDPLDFLQLRVGADLENDLERVLFYTETFNFQQGARLPGSTLDLIDEGAARSQRIIDLGAYLQATSEPIKSLPGLHLTGNVRVDFLRYGAVEVPAQFSWRFAAAYRFDERFVAKLIAGRAFQAPSGVQEFATPGFGTGDNIVGNQTVPGTPALRPQVANTIEVIASGQLFERLELEGALYGQRFTDSIQFIRSGNDFMAANRGTTGSLGVGLSARLAFKSVTPYLRVNYFARLPNAAGQTALAEAYPELMGIAGLEAQVPHAYLRLTGDLMAVGPRGASQSNVRLNNDVPYSLPAYAELNLSVSTAGLHPLSDSSETRASLTVRNALDGRHDEAGYGGFDVRAPGRSFLLELRQVF